MPPFLPHRAPSLHPGRDLDEKREVKEPDWLRCLETVTYSSSPRRGWIANLHTYPRPLLHACHKDSNATLDFFLSLFVGLAEHQAISSNMQKGSRCWLMWNYDLYKCSLWGSSVWSTNTIVFFPFIMLEKVTGIICKVHKIPKTPGFDLQFLSIYSTSLKLAKLRHSSLADSNKTCHILPLLFPWLLPFFVNSCTWPGKGSFHCSRIEVYAKPVTFTLPKVFLKRKRGIPYHILEIHGSLY